MSKYHSRSTEIDGIHFDSLAEANRYNELSLMVKSGDISDLRVHPRYELQPRFCYNDHVERAIYYEGDFEYFTPDGRKVVEDVKSEATKTPLYQVKRKLFLSKYKDLVFREVMV